MLNGEKIDINDFGNTLKSLGIGVEEIIDLRKGKFKSAKVVNKTKNEIKVYDGVNNFSIAVGPSIINSLALNDVIFLSGRKILREKELGVGDNDRIIKSNVGVGLDFYDIYGNIVFDLEVPTNRFDFLSHLGIAREFVSHHGIEKEDFQLASCEFKCSKEFKKDQKWNIEVKDSDLFAYTGVRIENISIRSSPFDIKWKLFAAGLRPINNIVDITNYILLKYGQPMHAFDIRFLDGKSIIVRRAKKSEKIKIIGGSDVELNEDVMVIADQKKPIAIAGIIGGEESEVREDTRSIILECADFAPYRIKRGIQVVKIITDSSKRFETRIDPVFRKKVLEETIKMIEEITKGEVVGVFDYEKEKFVQRNVIIDPERIRSLLGMKISKEEIISLIEGFNFNTDEIGMNNKIKVYIPSFRHDIVIEEDMVEEIARIKGYDSVPEDFNISGYGGGNREEFSNIKRKIREFLTARGLFETVNLSFSNPENNRLFSDLQPVDIVNPISERWNQMRTSIIPSLLEVLRENLRYGIKDVRIFDIGRIYYDKSEEERLGILITGSRIPVFWGSKKEKFDIFDLKGILEDILYLFNVDFKFIPETPKNFSRGGKVEIKGVEQDVGFGVWGEIERNVLERLDLKSKVYIFEIPIHSFTIQKEYTPKTIKFPVIERDLSFIMARSVNVDQIKKYIESNKYFDEVHVFDYYSGKNIPQDKKVVGFRLIVYPVQQEDEKKIDNFLTDLVEDIENNFNITLRGGKNGRNFE